MGYTQIYTGNGKGKTTAAIGLSTRAVGAGFNVWFGQFMKKGDYSEVNSFLKLERIEHLQFGTGKFIMGKPSEEDLKLATNGYRYFTEAVKSCRFNVVVADEICTAVSIGIVEEKKLVNFLKQQHECEIILTGREASEALMEVAELVTEMREIKHYYSQGVQARVGIEK